MYDHLVAECLDCGHQSSYTPKITTCPNCGGGWREARYDYKTIGKNILDKIPSRPFDIWRLYELLPVEGPHPPISMNEGGTPLIQATNLGLMLGNSNIFIKDERQNPTGSFKDRQSSIKNKLI